MSEIPASDIHEPVQRVRMLVGLPESLILALDNVQQLEGYTSRQAAFDFLFAIGDAVFVNTKVGNQTLERRDDTGKECEMLFIP